MLLSPAQIDAAFARFAVTAPEQSVIGLSYSKDRGRDAHY
jgi:hypothetical protein